MINQHFIILWDDVSSVVNLSGRRSNIRRLLRDCDISALRIWIQSKTINYKITSVVFAHSDLFVDVCEPK